MTNLYPPSEFDDWAEQYDLDVAAEKGFPFEGYSILLQTMTGLADPHPDLSVLDLGTGTGNLAKLFADRGGRVWGLDFSEKMIALAREKLPSATLAVGDLRNEWPTPFQRRFDYITSAFAFHHFPLQEKVRLIRDMRETHLRHDGMILIGDIAFQDANEMNLVSTRLGDDWEQEYYWLADESIEAFARVHLPVTFTKVTPYAGIFLFR